MGRLGSFGHGCWRRHWLSFREVAGQSVRSSSLPARLLPKAYSLAVRDQSPHEGGGWEARSREFWGALRAVVGVGGVCGEWEEPRQNGWFIFSQKSNFENTIF
jgi:hypothetical protein